MRWRLLCFQRRQFIFLCFLLFNVFLCFQIKCIFFLCTIHFIAFLILLLFLLDLWLVVKEQEPILLGWTCVSFIFFLIFISLLCLISPMKFIDFSLTNLFFLSSCPSFCMDSMSFWPMIWLNSGIIELLFKQIWACLLMCINFVFLNISSR